MLSGNQIFPHAQCGAGFCSEGFSRDCRASRHLDRSLLWHTILMMTFSDGSYSLLNAMWESDCCTSPLAARGPS